MVLTNHADTGYTKSFFSDQIHGIFHWVKIFITEQSYIFWYALHLRIIIVTLEMKQITIWAVGLIFIKKPVIK